MMDRQTMVHNESCVEGEIIDVDRLPVLVESQRVIYDVTLKEHHNQDVIAKCWHDISLDLNVSGMLEIITSAGFVWMLFLPCSEGAASNFTVNLQNTEQHKGIINSLYKFMLEVGSVYFEEVELIHIVLPLESNDTFNNANLNDITTFVEKLQTKWPALISKTGTNVTNSSTIYIKISHYFLFLTTNATVNEINCYLQLLQLYEESWNPKGLFMIVLLQSENTEMVILLFNHLWSKNIFNTILFLTEFNLTNETEIITALPYKSNKLCRKLHNSNELVFWDSNSSLDSNIELFNFDIPKDFHGCSMVAKTYPFPPYSIAEEFEDNNITKYKYISGIEINLVKLLADKFNINIIFETPDMNLNPWVHFFPDGRAVGIIPDLFELKTDIAFAGVIPVSESYFKLEFTKFHSFGSISWFVADPSALPQWTIIIRVFKTRAWIILGITFLIFSLVFYLISKFSSRVTSESQIYKSYSTIMMSLFVLGLNNPMHSTPKTIYLRVLFFTWSIFSLHIVITYQQNLFSLMVNPTLEASINTLEQLQESGLTTCLSGLFHSLFARKFNDKNIQNIFDNHVICNNIDEAVELLMKYKNFSILDKSENIEFIDKNMAGNFHRVADVLLTYNVGMMTSKGNIILDSLNTVIQRAQEAGLIVKWESDIKSNSDSSCTMDSHHLEALTIDDLQGAFLILFVGLSLSLTAFMCEMYWFNFNILHYQFMP